MQSGGQCDEVGRISGGSAEEMCYDRLLGRWGRVRVCSRPTWVRGAAPWWSGLLTHGSLGAHVVHIGGSASAIKQAEHIVEVHVRQMPPSAGVAHRSQWTVAHM